VERLGKFRLAIFNTQPPHLYFGGVERRIIETAKRLQNEAEITVYSGTKAGFKKTTTIDGINLVSCYSTDRLFPLDNWFFNRSISKKAAVIDAEVYEAHAVSGHGLIKTLKKQGIKKPFIHTIHGVLADEYEQARKNGYDSFRDRVANYFMSKLAEQEEQTAQNATLVVTISQYSLRKIKQFYGVNEAKVRVVPNGVDPEKFKPLPNRETARKQYGLDDGESCVLFVGSLIPRKGLLFLIEAARKIIKENNRTKFLIVGEGPLRNQLQSTLNSLNLTGNFKFFGSVKDDLLPTVYNCADVFVLPSIQEGQGIVLLEAEASAVPVVAFNVGGINEAIRNGETGLLATRGKSNELADAIMRLLSDKALREKMGANGRKLVADNFAWDVCAQKMLHIYREALGDINVN
jgi:glycogen(starch) synthase